MILSSAFHRFQKLTKRIALSWVKRRHLQTTSHTSNSSLRWYGKVVIHIFYLRFLDTPSLRRLWIPFLSKRFHVYCGWQQGGLWMLESDWERRKLQQMILNKNLWVRNSTSFLAWFCSTAEDISDGGGKGEDQQFSISNNDFTRTKIFCWLILPMNTVKHRRTDPGALISRTRSPAYWNIHWLLLTYILKIRDETLPQMRHIMDKVCCSFESIK